MHRKLWQKKEFQEKWEKNKKQLENGEGVERWAYGKAIHILKNAKEAQDNQDQLKIKDNFNIPKRLILIPHMMQRDLIGH